MDGMQTGENIKEGTLQSALQINAGVNKLAPYEKLPDQKPDSQQSTDREPLFHPGDLVATDSSACEFNGNAARQENHRVSPDEPRQRDVLPLRHSPQHDVRAAETGE